MKSARRFTPQMQAMPDVKPVIAAFCALALLLSARPAFASAEIDDAAMRNAVEAAAKAEGTSPGDFELFDQDGVKFHLADYFRSGRPAKPLVVSFIYTKCPHVCPSVTAEVKRAAGDARLKFGEKFNVLSISIDPAYDSPQRLRDYGLRYTHSFDSMRFATPSAKDVKALAGGFGFFFIAKNDGSFDHIDMASVMRPDGTIYKQVYSVRTDGSGIRDRLDELITGKPAVSSTSLVDRIKFFCYRYDPYSNRYVIDYPIIVSVFLQSVVFAVIIGLVWGRRIKGFFARMLKAR